MSILLSERDYRRVERAVIHVENEFKAAPQDPNRKRFFSAPVLKQFKLLDDAQPPQGLDNPRAVHAQPFEGDNSPKLAWLETKGSDGKHLPVREQIFHHVPGMYLCEGTLVWCVWAYSRWRIVHAEQWPVMVQQIRADGFPNGDIPASLTITRPATEATEDEPASEAVTVTHGFTVSAQASAGELLAAVREHPLLLDRSGMVQASGADLTFCDINLMFGPALTGYTISPIVFDNGGQPTGRGLRVSILAPLWSVQASE